MRDPEISSRAAIVENRSAYGRIAAKWEQVRENEYDVEFHTRCRSLFFSHLKGTSVLDVGCGLGEDCVAFKAAGLRVTASDIAGEFLDIVRRKKPDIDAVAMDMTSPCFGPDSFDGIFGFASLLHVPSDLALETLLGFGRMLKPGGILFLHHVASSIGISRYSILDLLMPDNPAYCFCHTESELSTLISTAGFSLCSLTHFRSEKPPSPISIKYGLVAYQVIAKK